MYRDYIYVIFLSVSLFFPLSFFLQAGPLLCYSPKDEGLCSSSVPRYYYDSKTKSCKEFRYTGCGGNANNFVTETDCYNVCRKGKGVFFVFCQSQAGKAIHIPVTSVHSVLLLTLACYRGMLFVFWTQCFQRQGKLKYDAKSFWQDQCDVR